MLGARWLHFAAQLAHRRLELYLESEIGLIVSFLFATNHHHISCNGELVASSPRQLADNARLTTSWAAGARKVSGQPIVVEFPFLVDGFDSTAIPDITEMPLLPDVREERRPEDQQFSLWRFSLHCGLSCWFFGGSAVGGMGLARGPGIRRLREGEARDDGFHEDRP